MHNARLMLLLLYDTLSRGAIISSIFYFLVLVWVGGISLSAACAWARASRACVFFFFENAKMNRSTTTTKEKEKDAFEKRSRPTFGRPWKMMTLSSSSIRRSSNYISVLLFVVVFLLPNMAKKWSTTQMSSFPTQTKKTPVSPIDNNKKKTKTNCIRIFLKGTRFDNERRNKRQRDQPGWPIKTRSVSGPLLAACTPRPCCCCFSRKFASREEEDTNQFVLFFLVQD